MISHERLREVLSYDPHTGVFTWRVTNSNRARAGTEAGSVGVWDGQERRSIFVDGRRYKAHRLAVFYEAGEWPAGIVDHINGNAIDNRIANLRVVTPLQSVWNTGGRRKSTSGLKGVSLHRKTGLWLAQIRENGAKKFLGYFKTQEDAAKAYQAKARVLHGEFYRNQ